MACHYLAPILGQFIKRCPRVQLRIESGVTPAISNLVEGGEAELGFVLLPLKNPRLELRPVLHYRHIAVFPPGRVESQGSSITVAELCALPLVLLTRESATRHAFDDMVAAKGLEPARVLEVPSVSVQKAMVRAGLGIGILPDYALETQDGILPLPIQGSRRKTLALCYLQHRTLSTAATQLMELLRPGTG